MCTRPSMPSSMPTKMPKSVMLRTLPLTTVPTGSAPRRPSRGSLELLHAEADALVLRVDAEDDGLDLVADR
jgi:hypothetical protein